VSEKEYIIFCDESEKKGKYYSNFYGGLIVGSSHYERVTRRLNAAKQELNLFGEIKWEKVTERYLSKYQAMVHHFFEEIAAGAIKVRLMFRHNARQPQGLTEEQKELQYYLLYYQFIKHAFGLPYNGHPETGMRLRLYFDTFPDTGEKVTRFKGFLLGLRETPEFRTAHIRIAAEDITEVHSHDHVLLQCLDIVLGSMVFRLNDKHKELPPGMRVRGKRTRAKEALYKMILQEVRKLHKNFNIGVSTSTGGSLSGRWEKPYLHWVFEPKSANYEAHLTKRKQGKK
jgi:hypothetical protein